LPEGQTSSRHLWQRSNLLGWNENSGFRTVMTPPTREDAHRLLQLPEEDLLAEIVETLPPYRAGAWSGARVADRVEDVEGWVSRPREVVDTWLDGSDVLLYGKLCIQNNLCEKMASPGFGDSVTLVLIVGDMISSVLVGVPPFTVAALLVKRGMKSFCHCGNAIGDERKARLLGAALSMKRHLSSSLAMEGESKLCGAWSEIARNWLAVAEDVIQALPAGSRHSEQEGPADKQ